MKLIRRLARRGKTATRLKRKISQENRLSCSAGPSTAAGDWSQAISGPGRRRKHGEVEQCTAQSTQSITGEAGRRQRHIQACICVTECFLQRLWSSGLLWVKYRLLMIVLQEYNLLKCTNYTKGGRKRNRNMKPVGLLCFSVTAVNHNHHFSFKNNMELVVDVRSAPLTGGLEDPERPCTGKWRAGGVTGNTRVIFR